MCFVLCMLPTVDRAKPLSTNVRFVLRVLALNKWALPVLASHTNYLDKIFDEALIGEFWITP